MDLARRAGAVVLVLGVATGAAACGGDTPQVCADVDALKSDLSQLKDVQIQAGALAEMSTDLDQVESDLGDLADSAASQYDTEVDAVRSATTALRDSVEAAVQDPSGAALTQVSSDLGAFSTAVGDLGDALASTC
jgi:methyl-accepting chemotaxis protein